MNPRALRLLVCLLLVVSSANLARRAMAAQTISDEKLGFSLQVPDGFEKNSSSIPQAAFSLTYLRGRSDEPSFAVLQLGSLDGTIGRGKPDQAIVESSAREAIRNTSATITHFDYRQMRWKSFDLDLVVAQVTNPTHRLVTLTVQVPLAHQALQLNLVGPAADEKKLLSELQGILDSLRGKSNWLTDEEQSERLGRGFGLLFGITLVGVTAFLVVLRRRKQG